MLGEAFGNGIVIAPPQEIERSLWNEVTVATVVPPPAEGASAITIDQVIDTAMQNMRDKGYAPQTLQRQVRTVDGMPAQMLKLRYRDQDTSHDWIEELVFVEGPDHEIYSVALKASPASLQNLEPAFAGILRSWKLQHTDVPTEPATQVAPSHRP